MAPYFKEYPAGRHIHVTSYWSIVRWMYCRSCIPGPVKVMPLLMYLWSEDKKEACLCRNFHTFYWRCKISLFHYLLCFCLFFPNSVSFIKQSQIRPEELRCSLVWFQGGVFKLGRALMLVSHLSKRITLFFSLGTQTMLTELVYSRIKPVLVCFNDSLGPLSSSLFIFICCGFCPMPGYAASQESH